MGSCNICNRTEEGLSLLTARHKELGRIKVCRNCWQNLYAKNRFVSGTTGSSGSCPTCR